MPRIRTRLEAAEKALARRPIGKPESERLVRIVDGLIEEYSATTQGQPCERVYSLRTDIPRDVLQRLSNLARAAHGPPLEEVFPEIFATQNGEE